MMSGVVLTEMVNIVIKGKRTSVGKYRTIPIWRKPYRVDVEGRVLYFKYPFMGGEYQLDVKKIDEGKWEVEWVDVPSRSLSYTTINDIDTLILLMIRAGALSRGNHHTVHYEDRTTQEWKDLLNGS